MKLPAHSLITLIQFPNIFLPTLPKLLYKTIFLWMFSLIGKKLVWCKNLWETSMSIRPKLSCSLNHKIAGLMLFEVLSQSYLIFLFKLFSISTRSSILLSSSFISLSLHSILAKTILHFYFIKCLLKTICLIQTAKKKKKKSLCNFFEFVPVHNTILFRILFTLSVDFVTWNIEQFLSHWSCCVVFQRTVVFRTVLQCWKGCS